MQDANAKPETTVTIRSAWFFGAIGLAFFSGVLFGHAVSFFDAGRYTFSIITATVSVCLCLFAQRQGERGIL